MMLFFYLILISCIVVAQDLICSDGHNVTCAGYDSGNPHTQKLLFNHELSHTDRSTYSSYGNTFYFQRCSDTQYFTMTPDTFADPNDPSCKKVACGDIETQTLIPFDPRNYGNGTMYFVALYCRYTSGLPTFSVSGLTIAGGDGDGGGSGHGSSRNDASTASTVLSVF